jgi:hypothetical protein
MLSSEPARCKNCGNEQLYTKVLSWNTWLDPEYPANNKCYKCGTEISYDDIDLSACSPSHREEIRFIKIHERFELENEETNTDKIVCPKCGNNKLSHVYSYVSLPDKYKDQKYYSVAKESYVCNGCGHKRYKTIEEILACGLYEFVENGECEHEYIVRRVDNYQEIIDQCVQWQNEELTRIENELVAEGLIPTREEEQEYHDKYYEGLRKYWRN